MSCRTVRRFDSTADISLLSSPGSNVSNLMERDNIDIYLKKLKAAEISFLNIFFLDNLKKKKKLKAFSQTKGRLSHSWGRCVIFL